MSADGPCVSCHTGMTYLLARPALRRVLKESQPTMYEVGLLDRLRAKVGEKPAGALQGVETIFSAMFLSREDAMKTMSAHTQKAFDQLWTLQSADGPSKGGWRWYAANLDPWENTESGRYGASLAAVALVADARGVSQHAEGPRARRVVDAPTCMDSVASRRLHDRLALLLARAFIPDSLAGVDHRRRARQAAGRWRMDDRVARAMDGTPDAPPAARQQRLRHCVHDVRAASRRQSRLRSAPGESADVARSRIRIRRPAHGQRSSMNKRYPEGSMESLFMQDAATAFASLALIEAGR